MGATLFRSAFYPIIANAHNASHKIYYCDSGATPGQGKSDLPIFVGAMSFAVCPDGNWSDAVIYDSLALPAGAIVPRMAILEQLDEMIFVDSGLVGQVDSFGNFLMARCNDKNR